MQLIMQLMCVCLKKKSPVAGWELNLKMYKKDHFDTSYANAFPCS